MFIQRYCQKLARIENINKFSGISFKFPSLLNHQPLVVCPTYQTGFSIQSIFLLYPALQPFCTTKQQNSPENEIRGVNLASKKGVNKILKRFSYKESEMAEDILTTILRDFKEVYSNEELKKSSLYQELFEEGIKWTKLFSSGLHVTYGRKLR